MVEFKGKIYSFQARNLIQILAKLTLPQPLLLQPQNILPVSVNPTIHFKIVCLYGGCELMN